MTSQRQIKFLLQIFLFWYIINFTGKLLQGWDKMRSTHNYPDTISIPTVLFFSLRAMCLPLYCTIRNKNHSLHRLKQPWDGGSQCNRFFGWSNLDVKESHLNSRCCQLVQWIKKSVYHSIGLSSNPGGVVIFLFCFIRKEPPKFYHNFSLQDPTVFFSFTSWCSFIKEQGFEKFSKHILLF